MATTVEGTATLPSHLAGPLDVLMIDNFDSFTWNLYQQLCLLGANVTVVRNDAISAELLPQLRINLLIISPGPGHPQTDSGISREAIRYFAGKVPILGVCMGLECLVDLYGGTIGYAGEIMHGKVSRIRHDNRGCFRNVPQGIKSIRYHSLSASYETLPADLAITSVTEESGVIMGVRHRKYTLEAVQYHPESILSEGGDDLVKNFLSLRGGLWEQNPEVHVLDPTIPPFVPDETADPVPAKVNGSGDKVPSILEKIQKQRLLDVDQAQATPGSTIQDLLTLHSLNVSPTQIDFLARIKQNTSPDRPAMFAEIKRASPSKGPIAVNINPAAQALKYALAGAHTISVLTEPKWFLGSLHDMLHVRQAVANLPNRPAILRKDFILTRYQVLESRIWGADTILLIVSMLSEPLLRDLYTYARELGMEPLVEVNNAREMEIALSLSAKVIGVNNRNLHDFNVDMNTTSRLSDMTKGKDVVLCALSGIACRTDVDRYKGQGVGAVLVGESLMRAKDAGAFIRELVGDTEPETKDNEADEGIPLVKICGVKTREQALAIADAGADLLGLMFVKKSKRYVDRQTAKDIAAAIRERRFNYDFTPASTSTSSASSSENTPWFTTSAKRLTKTTNRTRPLLVGVFQNHSLEEVLETVADVQLDLVQLHGNEPVDWASHIPVPVIRVFHLGCKDGKIQGVSDITRSGAHQFILFDSMRDDGLSGGSGKVVDWVVAKKIVESGEILVNGQKAYLGSTQEVNGTPATTSSIGDHRLPIILAGGLTPENVASAVNQVKPWAVDVSGGVELKDGSAKDLDMVREFIARAKGIFSDSASE
ncbi:anthranilate synthase [Macrolepiota fuliginosa MF-IS2]|uniref:Multifunctional tryptophan biosynthesis protein n=1 Tax=Macrolepiota fuliginosa MF-IS2 TaxID=1400762 RepID=A0A9P5XND2_9AGAR|nr:anthranilate synthase [Macrolepiota fuliginosa MF-IS2]